MAAKYFTADLHFLHKNIIKYSRPYLQDVGAMNELIIKVINETVTAKDTLYILGDIALGSVELAFNYLCRINCKISVIPGNHDDPKLLRLIAEHPTMEVLPPLHNLKVNNQQLAVLCHFPLAVWDRKHYGSWHLHGHSHASYHGEGKILDVGLDSYYQIYGELGVFSVPQIEEIMRRTKDTTLDHHCTRNPR